MSEYPVKFAVDYPERQLNRLTSFFRIFTIIPIAILLSTITGYSNTYGDIDGTTVTVVVSGIGILFVPVLLMILFRAKYPRGGSTGTSSCSASATGSASTRC